MAAALRRSWRVSILAANRMISLRRSWRVSILAANRMISTARPRPSALTWLMSSTGGEVVGVYKRGDGEELVGSSHGWLALFNRRDNRLSLLDPTGGGQRTELPSPVGEQGSGISKVVLSSSPRDPDCCAMMTLGPANRLAFCFLHRSSQWTPIGDPFLCDSTNFPFILFADVHDDLVYCSGRRLFTSVTPCEFLMRCLFEHGHGHGHGHGHDHDCYYLWDRRFISLQDARHVEESDSDSENDSENENENDEKMMAYQYESTRYDWDIHNSAAAASFKLKLDLTAAKEEGGLTLTWCQRMRNMQEEVWEWVQIPHLVYAEHTDKLFLVLRLAMLVDQDTGSPLPFIPYCVLKGLKDIFPCKTFGFVVMEMNSEGRCTIVDDLDGLTMFIGINNSFAIPASESNQFLPNSIYFTDAKRSDMMSGVNDNGIFDYQNKTMLPLNTSTGFRFIEFEA